MIGDRVTCKYAVRADPGAFYPGMVGHVIAENVPAVMWGRGRPPSYTRVKFINSKMEHAYVSLRKDNVKRCQMASNDELKTYAKRHREDAGEAGLVAEQLLLWLSTDDNVDAIYAELYTTYAVASCERNDDLRDECCKAMYFIDNRKEME